MYCTKCVTKNLFLTEERERERKREEAKHWWGTKNNGVKKVVLQKRRSVSEALYSRVKQKSKTTRKEAIENKYEIVLMVVKHPLFW